MKRKKKHAGPTRGVITGPAAKARLLPHLPEPTIHVKRTIHLSVVALIVLLLTREDASAADWSFVALSVIVEII